MEAHAHALLPRRAVLFPWRRAPTCAPPPARCCAAGACGPMRRARRRGYRELLIVLGIFTFGHSIAAAFYAVYLSGDLGLSPAFIASLYGIGFFVAALG